MYAYVLEFLKSFYQKQKIDLEYKDKTKRQYMSDDGKIK